MSQSTMAANPVVRKVGIVLTLSPFANFFYSSYLQQHSLWETAKSITVVNWVLWAAALGAGLMMIRGKQKSWLFAFFLMAINVLYGVFTFKKQMLSGGWPQVGSAWFQPAASLAVNIGFLIFIYRLEFHGAAVLKASEVSSQLSSQLILFPRKKTKPPAKKKFAIQLQRNIHIDFVGVGVWARVVEVSDSGIVLRMLTDHEPENIRNKILEMMIAPGVIAKFHFFDVIDDFYEFHYVQVSPEQLDQIRVWAAG